MARLLGLSQEDLEMLTAAQVESLRAELRAFLQSQADWLRREIGQSS